MRQAPPAGPVSQSTHAKFGTLHALDPPYRTRTDDPVRKDKHHHKENRVRDDSDILSPEIGGGKALHEANTEASDQRSGDAVQSSEQRGWKREQRQVRDSIVD